MLYKTRGIVLNSIKYKDTSVIVKIYTDQFGIQSYIQNGARSPNSKTNKMAFFQPLTLLDLVVYHKPNHDLHRISEIKTSYIFKTLHHQFQKVAITTFLSELIFKCVKEETKNEPLFEFIYSNLIYFDEVDDSNFHLRFMIHFTKYLGFLATDVDDFFISLTIANSSIAELEVLKNMYISLLNSADAKFTYSAQNRATLINFLVDYYQIHIANFGEMKSLKILREL